MLRWQPGLDLATLRPAIERLRRTAQARAVAVLLEDRADLVAALELDGVHLTTPAGYRDARRSVGPDLIVGVGCATRDDAMTAAEDGADYVAFGSLDDAAPADLTIELTEWWSALMTVPCVAAGGATPDDAVRLRAAGADFIALAAALWTGPPGPAVRLREIGDVLNSPQLSRHR